MFTLCGFNSLAMLIVEMNLSSLVYCLQDLEMLLFIYILFEYGLYLSSSFIIFRISLFRFYKLGRSMSLISLHYNIPENQSVQWPLVLMSLSLKCSMAHALSADRLRLACGLPT
jgi:hypothetical protein